MKFFTILLFTCLFFSTLNAQLNCTDCPNGDFVDGILTSELEIINPGPDDIGQNILTEICVTVQHSWLSDIAVSLESPNGLNYILLGDDDNTWGGCQGPGVANADICFVLGSANPLTVDGLPYVAYCSGANACLEGDYTPTCGAAAYTPDFLAFSTPNCDIIDYSIPGNTISGIWTLRLYCVCPDLEVAGFLENWSLNFQDPSGLTTGESEVCEAFAGSSSTEPVTNICSQDNEIVTLNPISSNGQEIPNSDGFHYGTIAVYNNTIVAFSETNEMETEGWDIQFYHTLRGISYHENALDLLNASVGDLFVNLQAEEIQNESVCFDISDFMKIVIVEVPTEMIEIYTLCEGAPLDIYGTTITSTGDYVFETDINEACDAIVYVEVLPDDATSFEKIYPRVCEGATVEMSAENGMSYLWSGPNGFTSTAQTIVLNNADVNTSGTYTCEVGSFEGCVGTQVTELSLRCETRLIEIELGYVETISFDQIVGDVDECIDITENVAEVDFTTSAITISATNEGEEKICFQAYENGLLKNITFVVNVGTPNSIVEPDIDLDIRPNPASDYLQIDAHGVNIEYIQFFDTKGALAKIVSINDSKADVIVEDVIMGLYILKIKTSEGVLVRKLVVE